MYTSVSIIAGMSKNNTDAELTAEQKKAREKEVASALNARAREAEDREKTVLDASYNSLSGFDKFRLKMDLVTFNRKHDMDTILWFLGKHDDILTNKTRERATKLWGDTKEMYENASAPSKMIGFCFIAFALLYGLPSMFSVIAQIFKLEEQDPTKKLFITNMMVTGFGVGLLYALKLFFKLVW